MNAADSIDAVVFPAQSATEPEAIVTEPPFVAVDLPKSNGDVPLESKPEVESVARKPAVCVPLHQP